MRSNYVCVLFYIRAQTELDAGQLLFHVDEQKQRSIGGDSYTVLGIIGNSTFGEGLQGTFTHGLFREKIEFKKSNLCEENTIKVVKLAALCSSGKHGNRRRHF